MIEVNKVYKEIKDNIQKRFLDFVAIKDKKDEKKAFLELVFCLFTPQSKAKYCWQTVKTLEDNNLIFHGSFESIVEHMNYVRFKNNKTKYLLEARSKFFDGKNVHMLSQINEFSDSIKAREWLVNEIKGYGCKEASHFLRNTGYGEELAILDRHILKNLKKFGVIDDEKVCLTKNKYLEIEKDMLNFSKKCDIPMAHLDFVLWFMQTGEVFK